MALVQTTLASGLANLIPADAEADAIEEIAKAWEAYFAGASVLGSAITAGVYEPALAVLRSSLAGLSNADAAQKIQDSISAFWSALAPIAPALWVMPPNVAAAPIVPPPGISGMRAALQTVFNGNRSASLGLEASAANIASVLAANGGLGGTVTIVPPPPASPFVAPIL